MAICFPIGSQASTDYQFTRVAQTQPGITDFNTFALNNSGQVAYTTLHPDQGTSVYRWSSGQTLQFATEGSLWHGQPIAVPGAIDINDAGTVAFATARFVGHQSGIAGVFRTDGNELIRLAPFGHDPPSFVAHWVHLSNDGSAIYLVGGSLEASDGQSTQIVYSDSASPSFHRVNNASDIVFTGFLGNAYQPYQTILIRNGVHEIIADTGPTANPQFHYLSGTNINSHGRVVFIGNHA
jgi:hypothetical protein